MALTKIVASRSGHRTTLIPFSGIVDDGSTLSLDFTTGVLDPRLTFQRLSNATFINSSGQVKYAEQNLFFNTNFAGISGSNPTLSNVGWSYGFTAGTATFNGDGSVTMSASSGRYTINRTTSFTGSGRRIIVSVDITSNGDTGLVPTQLLRDGTLTNSVYYINSTLYTSGNVVGPCTLTFVADSPTAGTSTPFFGIGTSGNVTATVTFARPRFGLWDGTFPLPYVVNTSSGASPSEYHGPRFDYDPTSIGTQRGLLIEGSANNLLFWSESFATSGAASNWAYNSNTGAVVTTDNPAGGTTAFQFAETANSGPLQQSATVTNVVHTFSAWFKGSVYNSVTTTQVQFGLFTTGFIAGTASIVSGAGSTSVAGNIVTLSGLSTTQWTRVQFTTSAAIPAGAVAILIYPQSTAFEVNRSFYIWGAQLEAGSGASSYIPTGASTGNRAADNCYIYDTTSSGGLSWFKTATQGTFYVEMFKRSAGTAFAAAGYGTRGTATQDFMLYQAVGNNWLSFNWGAGENIVNYTALSSPFLIKSAAALSPRVGTPTTADVLQSINGTAGTLNTSPNVTLPFTSDLFCIGSRGPSGGTASSQNYAETAIRRIKFFPFAMTAAQMNALTTL